MFRKWTNQLLYQEKKNHKPKNVLEMHLKFSNPMYFLRFTLIKQEELFVNRKNYPKIYAKKNLFSIALA